MPIDVQLALFERCDLLVAPHRGFAFLAPAVGTPWLALSSCPWPEYLLAGVPFHSVLPECGCYPAGEDATAECNRRLARGERPSCMSDSSLAARTDEILQAADSLLCETSFADTVRAHLTKIDAHPGADRFAFFDGRRGLLGCR